MLLYDSLLTTTVSPMISLQKTNTKELKRKSATGTKKPMTSMRVANRNKSIHHKDTFHSSIVFSSTRINATPYRSYINSQKRICWEKIPSILTTSRGKTYKQIILANRKIRWIQVSSWHREARASHQNNHTSQVHTHRVTRRQTHQHSAQPLAPFFRRH